jgi:hypothetical protein
VKRRTFRPFVYALVAAQLLLSVPMAQAGVTAVSSETDSIQALPCDEMPSTEQHAKHCPCCPDGATDTMDCQNVCATSVAVVYIARFFLSDSAVGPIAEPLLVIFQPLADPPLKPPPIV